MSHLRAAWEDCKALLRSIPAPTVTILVASVVAMNLMANKELVRLPWLALDCGFAASWVSFLCMDVICKRFGAAAAVKVCVLALGVNLAVTGFLALACLVPGHWGAYYGTGLAEVDAALDATVGGTWYVVAGSSVALLGGSVVNALVNELVGRATARDTFGAFALRSYVSTGAGQLADNLIFAILVSHVFFGWSWAQVVACSLTGAAAELLCEVALSPVGYRVVRGWERERVGEAYLARAGREGAR